MNEYQPKHRGAGGLIDRVYESRALMIAVSVVIAVCLWFFISIRQFPNTTVSLSNVEISMDTGGTTAGDSGLSVISSNVAIAKVVVEGNRSRIGNLSADDLIVTADMSGITTAGTRELNLTAKLRDGGDLISVNVTPKRVRMSFDKIETSTVEVRPTMPNVSYAEGCVLNEEKFRCTPSSIALTGPEQELSKIAYCTAQVDDAAQLSESAVFSTNTLHYFNESGTELNNELIEHITYEPTSFAIDASVLYQKEMDITYQLTNVPTNFNTDWLQERLSLSEDKITLAAPDHSLDSMDSFSVGTVSLRDIVPQGSVELQVGVPEEYRNVSGFTSISLSLDDVGLMKKDFVISDISTVNAPSAYDFSVVTRQITVTVVGPEAVLAELDASDLTVNVDLLSYSTQADAVEGDSVTFNYTPTISCMKYDTVWAIGSYSVSVRGERKQTVTTAAAESTLSGSETALTSETTFTTVAAV